MMKRIYLAVIAAAALCAAPARANETEHKPESQHERFSHCAHESKGLKAEEHKKFMSECLKSHEGAPAHKAQQGKMKTCNDEAHAKNLHGDERRAFMSSCLKG